MLPETLIGVKFSRKRESTNWVSRLDLISQHLKIDTGRLCSNSLQWGPLYVKSSPKAERPFDPE